MLHSRVHSSLFIVTHPRLQPVAVTISGRVLFFGCNRRGSVCLSVFPWFCLSWFRPPKWFDILQANSPARLKPLRAKAPRQKHPAQNPPVAHRHKPQD